MDRHQRRHPERRPKITAISADQAEGFAILRRSQTEDDLLPADRVSQFERGGFATRCGLNPALARRALTQIGVVWVVPGNENVALVAGGGATCTRTETVIQRGLLLWGSSVDTRPSVVAHGLVMDGVAEVTLFAAGEPIRFLQPGAKPRLVPVTIAVKENVYGAVLPGDFMSGRNFGPAGAIEFGPWAH